MRFTLGNFDVYLIFYIFAKTWNSKMHCFPIVLSLVKHLSSIATSLLLESLFCKGSLII